MPKNKKYTKAQKAAYAKRMAAKKKKPSTVAKQNQFRTEYKDRITSIISTNLVTVAGSQTSGPVNTKILIPEAMTTIFDQGTANGEVVGNNINLKYLSMKVKLDFTELDRQVIPAPTSTVYEIQRYNLTVRQVWIKKDLRPYLTADLLNNASGRTQPAFPDDTAANASWINTSNQTLYNARLEPEFLSYSKKQESDVVVLKTMRVMGDYTKNFSIDTSTQGQDVTPDKHMTFTWKMPQKKQLLSPLATGGSKYCLSSMWIPAVMVSLDRKYELNHESGKPATIPLGPLQISHISHLTYSDA